MRLAGRNHRQAIFGLIDDAIEDHRIRRLDHFANGGVELARVGAADSVCLKSFGELDGPR